MHYVAYLAIVTLIHLILVVTVLRVIRRWRAGGETDSWLWLSGKVFLLMLVANIVFLIPGIGIAGVVISLVGLMRLSGLDVLSTFILSFTLGVINLIIMIVIARHFDVVLLG